MDERETRALMDDVASVMKSLVANAMLPIGARLDALEKGLRDLPTPRDGKDGRDADIDACVAKAGEAILPKLRAVEDKVDALTPRVGSIAETLTVPQPSGPDMEAAWEKWAAETEKQLEQERLARAEEIQTAVEKAVAAIPKPKDGVDGKDGQDGQSGAKGDPGAPGAPGNDGRDGLDAVEFLRNADGHLIVTLSNGQTRDLGIIEAKDGAPGINGKDGERGADGRDGFGFDDLDLVETDKGIFIRFTKADAVKEFRLPVMFYRGVFKEGESYSRGHTVTYGGSLWHCDEDEATTKPDAIGQKGWTLCAKRGRDGRDGTVKEAKPAGPVKIGPKKD